MLVANSLTQKQPKVVINTHTQPSLLAHVFIRLQILECQEIWKKRVFISYLVEKFL